MQYLLRILRLSFAALRRVSAFLTGFAGKTWRHKWVFHAAHYLLVLIVTVVLGYYSLKLEKGGWFSDVGLPLVNKFYLAVQFLLVYAAVRLLVLVIRLLLMRDTSEFDDIERAWLHGMEELDFFNIDLCYTPIYLVLGLPRSDESHFFAASRRKWTGIAPDNEAEKTAPIRFYFDDEGVYLTCPAVGSLAEQNLKTRVVATMPDDDLGHAPGLDGPDSSQTLNPAAQNILGNLTATDKTVPPHAYREVLGGVTMMPTNLSSMAPFSKSSGQVGDAAAEPRMERLTQAEMDRQRRRLEFLCELIRQRRRESSGAAGYITPINGVLAVFPLAHTKTNVGFVGPAECLATDLQTLLDTLQLSFPVIAVETNLDHIEGLDTFLSRVVNMESQILGSRAGSRFPSGHPLREPESRWLVDRGLEDWFRGWIYKELSNNVSDRGNRRLFLFACNLLERRDRLVRQLELAFGKCTAPDAVRLAGLYFCSCGPNAQEHAFVQGVFQKMTEIQGELAWREPLIAFDQKAASLAKFLYLASLAVVGVGVWIGWKIFS